MPFRPLSCCQYIPVLQKGKAPLLFGSTWSGSTWCKSDAALAASGYLWYTPAPRWCAEAPIAEALRAIYSLSIQQLCHCVWKPFFGHSVTNMVHVNTLSSPDADNWFAEAPLCAETPSYLLVESHIQYGSTGCWFTTNPAS